MKEFSIDYIKDGQICTIGFMSNTPLQTVKKFKNEFIYPIIAMYEHNMKNNTWIKIEQPSYISKNQLLNGYRKIKED